MSLAGLRAVCVCVSVHVYDANTCNTWLWCVYQTRMCRKPEFKSPPAPWHRLLEADTQHQLLLVSLEAHTAA